MTTSQSSANLEKLSELYKAMDLQDIKFFVAPNMSAGVDECVPAVIATLEKVRDRKLVKVFPKRP